MKIGQIDRHWARSGELLKSRGIPAKDHVLLQENVATFLTHLDEMESSRWREKIDRDLAKPYTDGQVLHHVDELQNQLIDLVSHMPSPPSKVWLTGSFTKGRLGPHSDLDAYFLMEPGADVSALMKDVKEDGVIAFPLYTDEPGYNRAMKLITGCTQEVSLETLKKPGSLRGLYRETLAQRGIQVNGEACERAADTEFDRQETSKIKDWIADSAWETAKTPSQKWEKVYGDSWKSRATHLALSTVGRAAMLPGLGLIIESAVGLLEIQNHR